MAHTAGSLQLPALLLWTSNSSNFGVFFPSRKTGGVLFARTGGLSKTQLKNTKAGTATGSCISLGAPEALAQPGWAQLGSGSSCTLREREPSPPVTSCHLSLSAQPPQTADGTRKALGDR